MFLSEKEIFDTRFDTKKYFVTMRSRFSLRSEKNKDGKSLLYLDISDKFTRPRLKTNIYIEKKYWDATKQRVKPSPNYENFNLIIENLEAKIITIKTRYTIMQQFLSAERLIEEIQNVSPNFDFISFFRHHLNIQDHKPRTHKDHTSVLNKLMEFSKEIPFHKIDESFFANYRKWCTEVKKYFVDLTLKDSVLVGNKTLRFSEFDIVPPKKFGGMVSVKDDLNLAVSLKVKP
ncbi:MULTISPECIES: phage integrase SAM-like domain-containing protein [Cloacibacterium]|uniref:phage integrase SAM-like domain-containing protein n=1 Tax=Cloacibacterium TaxID=501783 RepID=UPI00352C4A6B